MHNRVVAGNLNSLWLYLLLELINNGEETAPRGMRTRELLGMQLILTDSLRNILTIPERNLNYSFMVAEWLWIMAARNDVESIAYYNSEIAKFSDDGKTFFGAYGPRIHEQAEMIITKLSADPDSRQAVLTIWQPNPPVTRDVPCTVAMQFFVRNSQLHAIVTMRSSDAWLGVPYDLFNFTRVQAWFACRLHLRPGIMLVNIGSSHIYEQYFDDARRILHNYILADDDELLERNIERLPDGRSPVLNVAPGIEFVRHLEAKARTSGATFRDGGPWTDYSEALAYRHHRDLARGDGHIMHIIRQVKNLRAQIAKEERP